MENFFAIFPHNGKNVSTLWKKEAIFPHNGKTFHQFSTQWKEFVHTVENSDLRLFSVVLGCSLGAVERSTRRPLSIVERDRPKRPGKRRPPKAVSALSRRRLGCGVGSGRFLVARAVVFRALRCEGGVACAAIFNGGLLIIPRGLRDHAAERRKARPQSRRAPRGRDGAGRGPESAPGRGRPPLSKWPRVSRVAGHSGRVAGGLAAPF